MRCQRVRTQERNNERKLNENDSGILVASRVPYALLKQECDSARMTMTLLARAFKGGAPSNCLYPIQGVGFSWLEKWLNKGFLSPCKGYNTIRCPTPLQLYAVASPNPGILALRMVTMANAVGYLQLRGSELETLGP